MRKNVSWYEVGHFETQLQCKITTQGEVKYREKKSFHQTKRQQIIIKSNNKRSLDGGPPPSVTYITIGGVLLLDQLFGALDLVQSDSLGRASRFADPLGMRLPLSFTLFVTRRWHEGSVGKYDKKKRETDCQD